MNLSKAEFTVGALLASGYETKEIASKLFRSYHTVVAHLKSIRIKNGLKNACEITREFVLAHGDPSQYVKTLLLIIQLSISLNALDIDLRKPVRTKTSRTRKEITI